MIDFKTICKTFRKRARNWEKNEGELGKIVASEIRGIVDVFEKEWREEKRREDEQKNVSPDL